MTTSSSSLSSPRLLAASTRPFSSAVTDALLDTLQREYDEEKDCENDAMSDDLKDLYSRVQGLDWKIVDEGAMTRLFATRGARKVQIVFHCQDTVEEVEEVEEEDEEEEEEAPAFRFTVTVSKAGQTMGTPTLLRKLWLLRFELSRDCSHQNSLTVFLVDHGSRFAPGLCHDKWMMWS